ncbi:MAG: nucleotide sugar dehydrogenase [bacterium]
MTKSVSKKKPRNKQIAIIGLGYVGLPLACLAAEKGYQVIGVVRDNKKAEMINYKKSPIDDRRLQRWLKKVDLKVSTDFKSIKQARIIVVCVPTPIDENHDPDFQPLIKACTDISKYLKKGQLVIIESTINPGVCEEIILPILEKSGLKAGKHFGLAHCPERINPGDPKWTVRNIPRVVGALTEKDLKSAVDFYQSIIEGPVRPMGSIKAAEATKILENSFRDINIAFINEIAQSFDKMGIDVFDVIEGSKTKPFAFMAHYPSCGVGGHCIPVDPYYLIQRAKESGFDHRFLKLAREINNSMPGYTVNLLAESLNQIKRSVKGTKVGVLGLAYKANIEDTRESPAYGIIKILKQLGAEIDIFDPYVLKESTVDSLEELIDRVEALILVTNHAEFETLDIGRLKRQGIKVIIDGKNILPKDKIKKAGIIYRGIGRQ